MIIETSSGIFFTFAGINEAILLHVTDADGNQLNQKRFGTGEQLVFEHFTIASGFLFFYGALEGASHQVGPNDS